MKIRGILALLFLTSSSGLGAQQLARPPIAVQGNNGIIYVDGVKYKQTGAGIQAAINALPNCTIPHHYYNGYSSAGPFEHCGKVIMLAGNYTVSDTITVQGPFVTMEGSPGVATTLNCTQASGACIKWTDTTGNVGEFRGTGGLYDIMLDGHGAGAGTFGLQTDDVSGFHARGVVIQNFTAGPAQFNPADPFSGESVGWEISTMNYYDEKPDVEMSLYNNSVNVRVNTSGGDQTVGYGSFNLHFAEFRFQVGLQMLHGSLAHSIFHATFNQPGATFGQPGHCTNDGASNGTTDCADADAIQIFNSASFQNNVYSIEIESPWGVSANGSHHELNFQSTNEAPFQGVGSLLQYEKTSNVWTIGNCTNPCGLSYAGGWNNAAHVPSNNIGGHSLPPGWGQIWPTFETPDVNQSGPNMVFRVNPCPYADPSFVDFIPGCNMIDFQAKPSASYGLITIPSGISGTMAVSPDAGFNGTKTVGACTFIIENGIITSVTGC